MDTATSFPQVNTPEELTLLLGIEKFLLDWNQTHEFSSAVNRVLNAIDEVLA